MGSFNVKDTITNKDIYYGQEIYTLILKKQNNYRDVEVYINDSFTPICFPFLSRYNDYGSIEEPKQNYVVKDLEEEYKMSILDLLNVIGQDRNPYSTCSPLWDIIFKGKDTQISKLYKEYTPISYSKAAKLDSRIILEDENEECEIYSYKENKSNNDLYNRKVIFTTNKETEETNLKIVNAKTLEVQKEFDYRSHTNSHDIFEELQKEGIYLVYPEDYIDIIKKTLNLKVMYFSANLRDFFLRNINLENQIQKTKENLIQIKKDIKEEMDKELNEEIEYLKTKENKTEEEITELLPALRKRVQRYMSRNLEDVLYKYKIFPTYNRSKNIQNRYLEELLNPTTNQDELIKDLILFNKMNNHMENMNIIYRPSNYAGQERDREIEKEWFDFLSQTTSKEMIDELEQYGENVYKENLKSDLENNYFEDGEKFKIYGGEKDGLEVILKNKEFLGLKTNEVIDLNNIDFKFLNFIGKNL